MSVKISEFDKMLLDFVVRYGNDKETHRGFYDTYDDVMKEYNSITLDVNVTWKEILWEPLDKPDVQVIVKQDEVKVMEILGAKFVVPA